MPLLQDKVKAVREEASSALAAIGAAAMAGLIDALQHDDWLASLHAVEALGKLKSPDSVEPLLRALFNERDSARLRRRPLLSRRSERFAGCAVRDYLVAVMKEPVPAFAVKRWPYRGESSGGYRLSAGCRGRAVGRPEESATPCADDGANEIATIGMAARALGMIADAVAIPSLIVALRNTGYEV